MHIVIYLLYIILVQHPINTKVCEGNNAVLSCVVFDNSTHNAANTTSWFINANPPAAVSSNLIINTRDGFVVTSVLAIESVSLNDNGNGYLCSPAFGVMSNLGVISVAGEYEVFICVNIHLSCHDQLQL